MLIEIYFTIAKFAILRGIYFTIATFAKVRSQKQYSQLRYSQFNRVTLIIYLIIYLIIDTIRIFLFFRLYLFAFKLPSELRDMITNLFEMNESIKINLVYGLADFAQGSSMVEGRLHIT